MQLDMTLLKYRHACTVPCYAFPVLIDAFFSLPNRYMLCFLCKSSTSPTEDPIPRHSHRTAQKNCHRWVHLKPRATHKRRSRNRHQPRIRSQRTPALNRRRQIPYLPEFVHSCEHEPHGRCVDASQNC